MPRPFLARLLLVCCALALAVSVHAQSQATTGVIEGTVLDQSELALSLGADGFLRKPVTRQSLLAALDAQLPHQGPAPR